MDERDELAKQNLLEMMGSGIAAPNKYRSLFGASFLAVGGVLLLLIVAAGLKEIIWASLDVLWQGRTIFSGLLMAPFVAGIFTSWLATIKWMLPAAGCARCGAAVWGWCLTGAALYCVCNRMPPLIILAVLFTYGIPIQLAVMGMATAGAWTMQRLSSR